MQLDLAAIRARLIDETQDFDAENGKHARHQVEDQAAEEGEHQRAHQAAGWFGVQGSEFRVRSRAGCRGTWNLELGTLRGSRSAQWHIDPDSRDIPLRQREHAGQTRGVLRAGVIDWQLEDELGAAHAHRLRLIVGDEPVVGEKAEIGRGEPGAVGRVRREDHGFVGAGGGEEPAVGLVWQLPSRRGQFGAPNRIWRGGIAGDWQSEVERSSARNAGLEAHQPVGSGLESDARARCEIRRRRERDKEEHLAVVPVADDGAFGVLQNVRHRPLDAARLPAGWQRPLDRRGKARARVDPVGMPVRVMGETQRDVKCVTRLHRGHRRHQLGLDGAVADRRGGQKAQTGETGGQQAEQSRELHGNQSSEARPQTKLGFS